MIQLDIKKLRNFKEEGVRNCSTGNRHKSANKAASSQCVHLAINDHSRYASASIKEDETAESVTTHLIEIYQQYAARGIPIKRVLTDNGSGYKSKMFAEACQTINVKQIFTNPYTPQTKGKAERFIQTLLQEWTYARAYTSYEQKYVSRIFLYMYNWHRPHRRLNCFSSTHTKEAQRKIFATRVVD